MGLPPGPAPSEYGGKKRESDKPLKRCQLIKSEPLEPTSDYLSEELESEEDDEEKPQKARKPSGSRRPSQNPIPAEEEGEHTEDLPVDGHPPEEPGHKPKHPNLGRRAEGQVPRHEQHSLCRALGQSEEESWDELREAVEGHQVLLQEQGDWSGEGGKA